MNAVSPQIVLSHSEATKEFLCSPSKSTKKIQFTQFIIRDVDAGDILFEFNYEDLEENKDNLSEVMSYQFYPDYFDIKTIGITKIFKTFSTPIKNLLMIDRFYFRDTLIKSFEFVFPFCIPNSTNTWESIYEMPYISEKLKQQMILNPWETKSDTFYFVDNELILHQRAEYDYNAGQDDRD